MQIHIFINIIQIHTYMIIIKIHILMNIIKRQKIYIGRELFHLLNIIIFFHTVYIPYVFEPAYEFSTDA